MGETAAIRATSVTFADCAAEAVRALEQAGHSYEAARRDADLVARSLLHWDEADWLLRRREPAAATFRAAFDAAVARRCAYEPVAYITGTREFYGRPFAVSRDVLIPRPETELLVDEALAAFATLSPRPQEMLQVADVGTGSGCLAVTIALERRDVTIVATDVSESALSIAATNAGHHSVQNRIIFRHASLLGGASDRFDLVVSNPPYVSETERPTLMPDVRDYEPSQALFGGTDGLDVIRVLLPAAERALRPGGWLLFEIGSGQSDAVRALAATSTELTVSRIVPDLAGIPRVVVARRPLRSI